MPKQRAEFYFGSPDRGQKAKTTAQLEEYGIFRYGLVEYLRAACVRAHLRVKGPFIAEKGFERRPENWRSLSKQKLKQNKLLEFNNKITNMSF